jgi:hypothetical protein
MTAVPVSTQICGTGDSTDVTVTASGGTLPYSGTGVFPQGPDTTVYVVNDNNGCSASDTVIVNSPRYFITATSNGNGTITNPGTVQYYCGDTVTFSFTPADTCTRIVNVSVNGVAQGPVSSYTFNGLSSSGVISVSFGPVRYTVTANAGSGGLISGASSPVCGTDAVYTIVPNSCYQIADVLVDGVSVGPVTTYTFPAISAAHAISATFTQLSYTVTVISDSGGTATPLGTVTYACGDTVTVQFLPDPFKLVDSVVVDGVNIGPLNDYVFYGLDGNHTVLVYFSGCAVPAEVAAPDFAQLCLAQGSYQLDGTFSGSATYAFWSTSGSGVFDDPTVGVGTTYTPSAADIVAGSVYLFIVTDDPDGSGDCLAGTDSTLLTITSTVTVTINGPTSFCTGDTIVLTASGATDYVWFRNTTVNQIAQTASITTSLPGTYYVDGSIQGNCASSSQITVVEHPVPSVPVITPLTSTEFCYGDNVSLVSSYTTGNVWQDGDTAGVYLAMAGGFYRVTYTDPNGCSSVSDSVEVIVHPIPVVDILGLDSVYCLNAPDVSLTGSPSGGDFSGVAVISDVFYPGLAGAGFYLITYQFMDTNSCVGIDSQLVQVDICSEVPEIADPEMAVYPNPAHDRFAVSIGGFTSASTEYTVEITDQLGRRVLVLRADREVIYVSTETLYGPGLYLVRLTDSDGRIIRTKKVVVQ